MIARYTVGSGFDGSKGGLRVSDWARLELDSAIPGVVAPLAVAQELAAAGTPIAVAGYNQDRAQILMADLACHITGTVAAGDKALIAHDCDATRGTSGGPLLMQLQDGWAVVGINIGATARTNLAVSTIAFEK
jgi:protease YdgD